MRFNRVTQRSGTSASDVDLQKCSFKYMDRESSAPASSLNFPPFARFEKMPPLTAIYGV